MGFCLAINRVRDILALVEAQRRQGGAEDGVGSQADVWLYNDRFNTKQRVAAALAKVWAAGTHLKAPRTVCRTVRLVYRLCADTWDRELGVAERQQLFEML